MEWSFFFFIFYFCFYKKIINKWNRLSLWVGGPDTLGKLTSSINHENNSHCFFIRNNNDRRRRRRTMTLLMTDGEHKPNGHDRTATWRWGAANYCPCGGQVKERRDNVWTRLAPNLGAIPSVAWSSSSTRSGYGADFWFQCLFLLVDFLSFTWNIEVLIDLFFLSPICRMMCWSLPGSKKIPCRMVAIVAMCKLWTDIYTYIYAIVFILPIFYSLWCKIRDLFDDLLLSRWIFST